MITFSIGTKLKLAFALLTVFVGLFAIGQISKLHTSMEDLADNVLPSVVLLYRAQVGSAQRLTLNFAMARERLPQVELMQSVKNGIPSQVGSWCSPYSSNP